VASDLAAGRRGVGARLAAHAVAGAGFLLLAVVISWPLARHLTTAVPGDGPGDNLTFLWNFWWMRHALASNAAGIFQTSFLFYPFGTSLALDTFTPLEAFIGATLLAPLSIITAQNVVLLASLALNGFCTYLLAWHVTKHRAASLVAGLVFAASPYIAAHLHGHFNLTSAWPLPLFALMWLRLVERPSVARAALAGLVLAATAYTDYYYVVYLGVFVLCALGVRWLDVSWSRQQARDAATIVDWALGLTTAIFVVTAVLIAVTGGRTFHVGSIVISATHGLNVRTAAWVTGLAWLWRRWRLVARVRVAASAVPGTDLPWIAIAAVTSVVAALPLLAGAWHVWTNGDYTTQAYRWRSAPGGVDLASLVAGNPFHPVWGAVVRQMYAAMHMDVVESIAWMGVAVGIALVVTRATWLRRADALVWRVVAVVFFIWALGPSLTIGGLNTGFYLPAALVRFVPIVDNARMPGRAMVMVYLAAAVLLAVGMTSVWTRRRGSMAVVGALVLLDFLPAPFPLYTPDRPAIYATLAALPAGAVLDVPLGVRDGFGEIGALDPRTLYYQTLHGKPMVGGFVARLPATLLPRLERSPFLSVLLRLSAGEVVEPELLDASRSTANAFLARFGIRYVVVNTTTASADLQQYVTSLPVVELETSGERRLYVVRSDR
jgi:hypothetical protein